MTRQIVIGQPVVDWVALQLGRGEKYGLSTGIGVENDGQLIAGVVYNEFNGANCNMHVASDRSAKWLSREFLWMCFDYPFNQMIDKAGNRLKRITGFVEDDRTDAIIFDEHLGFEWEATLKDAHPNGDILVYVMRRENCRWLNLKRGKTPLLPTRQETRVSHEFRT